MANLSLRGLDPATLARIRSAARRRKVSVNRMIVDTLRQHYATAPARNDELAALAGTWSQAEADAFHAAIKPFSEIDAELWTAQPSSSYRVRRRRKRRT